MKLSKEAACQFCVLSCPGAGRLVNDAAMSDWRRLFCFEGVAGGGAALANLNSEGRERACPPRCRCPLMTFTGSSKAASRLGRCPVGIGAVGSRLPRERVKQQR